MIHNKMNPEKQQQTKKKKDRQPVEARAGIEKGLLNGATPDISTTPFIKALGR